MKCKICGRSVSSIKGLSIHLRNHTISAESYYSKYLKKNKKEGKCLICNKRTAFLSMSLGFQPYCCKDCANHSPIKQKHTVATNRKRRGVDCVFQDETVKLKAKKTHIRKRGVDNPSKDKSVIEKIKQTKLLRHGDEKYNNRKKFKETSLRVYNETSPSKSEIVKKKAEKTCLAKWGFKSSALNPNVKLKQQKTLFKHYKVLYPFSSKLIYNKGIKTRKKKTGYNFTLQDPSQLEKLLHNRGKSGAEKAFSSMLRKNKIRYSSEFLVKNDISTHHYDFAIFDKNKKLKCFVEIDGEYYHGLSDDCDGKLVRGDKDYIRWKLVSNGVKFLVIDSKRLNEGFEELLRMLPMSYKKWNSEMLRSIPRNMEDIIPSFSEKRMLKDWKHLCKYKYRRNAFLGKSILLHFCHSHWKDFDWKSVRKTLYKSPVSSHHLLEGLDHFKNTSKLREKFRIKYRGIKEVVVKHHSPEKMLAICSLGKTYISKEKIDKESVKIIKFLELKAYQF